MKNRKERILYAMQIILAEYRDKSHYCSVAHCQLCQQFYHDYDASGRHTCHKCPMFVFHNTSKKFNETSKKYSDDLSCLERKCKPISCREGQKMTKGLKKVIEFYERAIEGLEKLSNEDLASKNIFNYLLTIDNEVNEKHKVKKL